MCLITNNANRITRWVYWLTIFWVLFAFVIPPSLVRAEEGKQSQEELKGKSDFILTIKDNLISLSAMDTWLLEIIENLCDQMTMEAVTNILDEEETKTKFDKLSLENGIPSLKEQANISYLKGQGKITKIMVFPKRE